MIVELLGLNLRILPMILYVNKEAFWELEVLKPSLRWKCRHFLSTLYIKSLIQDKRGKTIGDAEKGLNASRISCKISRQIYGRDSWRQMVPRLKKIGAISVGIKSIVGKQCLEYRILPPYNREIQRFNLPQGRFRQKLQKTSEILAYAAVKGIGARWVIESYSNSSIAEGSDAIIQSLALSEDALIPTEAVLDAVKRREMSFTRCKAGRLHYPISNLKRELRSLLRLNGEEVCEIDATASQPTLHASMYGSDCEERRNYFAFVTSKRFYETVAEWGGFIGSRDECKDLVFNKLYFGSIHAKPLPAMWLRFCKDYPILASLMEMEKRKGNGALPYKMQKLESEIVIDTACQALKEAKIPVLTVHDSIIVPVSRKEEAKEIFRKSWISKVGFEPKFKS
jgi:hypothetical protein